MGLQDRRLPAGSFRASTSYNYNHGPERARLGMYARNGRTAGWVARQRNSNQYLQIDLGSMAKVTGIATQGRNTGNQYVKTYILQYSNDGKKFRNYKSYGRLRVSVVANSPS